MATHARIIEIEDEIIKIRKKIIEAQVTIAKEREMEGGGCLKDNLDCWGTTEVNLTCLITAALELQAAIRDARARTMFAARK